MAKINLRPMPRSYLSIPARLRPRVPPWTIGGPLTAAERELARELFRVLDPESQAWYRANGHFLDVEISAEGEER
jgi:hypothetical protein